MSNLMQYTHKKVRLVSATTGNEYTGYVGDYIYPEDNEPNCVEEAIVLDVKGFPNPIQFDAHEIKSIEIIEGAK